MAEDAAAPIESEKPTLTDTEQEAYADGWRPQAEFRGEPEKWVSAAEFMRRKPLFKKIDELKSDGYHTKRELQELKRTLTALSEHHKKVKETEYQRAIRDLQAKKVEAIEDRNGAAVVDIDNQIDEIRAQQAELATAASKQVIEPQPSAEYLNWVKENTWYTTDQEMHDFADGIGSAYFRRNPHLSAADVYDHVNKKVRQAFPEKFENPNRGRAPTVDAGNGEARGTLRKGASRQLSRDEEEVMNSFVSRGIMTREEYLKELDAIEKR